MCALSLSSHLNYSLLKRVESKGKAIFYRDDNLGVFFQVKIVHNEHEIDAETRQAPSHTTWTTCE